MNEKTTGKSTYPKLEGVVLYRIGKKAAGRLLDGRTWDEMPERSCDK